MQPYNINMKAIKNVKNVIPKVPTGINTKRIKPKDLLPKDEMVRVIDNETIIPIEKTAELIDLILNF
jgi:hypothetical protein